MSEQMDPSRVNSVPELGLQGGSNRVPPNLCAMGFGELLDTTVSLYRKHFWSFLRIVSGYFIAMLIAVLILFLDDSASRTGKIAIWIPTVGVIFGVCVCVVSGLVSVSAQAYLLRTVKIGAALKRGIYRFFPCFISALLFALLVILLAVFLNVLCEELCRSLVPRSYFNVLIVLTMVPVLGWFVTCWSFFVSTFLVERTPMRTGLRHCRDLIQGTWWRVAGMIFGVFLFSFAISFIFRTTIGSLLGLTEFASGEFVEMLLMGVWGIPVTRHGLSFSNSLIYLISLGGDAFVMSIWVIGGTLLYFNQRIRKEGFDIEMMATRQGE